MRELFALVLGALVVMFVPATGRAQGITIPAPEAVDMVHDARRGVVYISSGDGRVLRFHVASAGFLSPLMIGGQPAGIDLSPSGDELAIADRSGGPASVWIHLVDLTNLRSRKLSVSKAYAEEGTWSVAYSSNGYVLFSSRQFGSGRLPLRRAHTFTRRTYELGQVNSHTMLQASADRGTIAFAEVGSSDGPWGLYDAPTRSVVRRQGYQNGTGWFNSSIAVDHMGGQFALPTYNGTYIYDADYAHIAIIGTYGDSHPLSGVYHPAQPLAYFPWLNSSQVRIYDMRTFNQVGAYDLGQTVSYGSGGAMGVRIRISDDGRLLMVRVADGVRLIPTTATTTSGARTRRVR